MKCWHASIDFNRSALSGSGIALAFVLTLAACAGNQPGKVAGQAYRQPVKVTPEIRSDFVAAMHYIKSVEYDKAIKSLNKIIAQSPNNPVPYVNLALVYKKMQNLNLAEENLKLAIKAAPDNPVANNEYALLYRKTGRFTEARQTYEKILGKYPNFIMAHRNLGILCDLYMNDHECALKHYAIYSGFRPDDGNVKIWIADLQRK